MKKTIREYLSKEYLDAEEAAVFVDDTPLISSGLIDSISVLEVVSYLEDTFKFEFDPHEVDQENLNTVDLIFAFVKSKVES